MKLSDLAKITLTEKAIDFLSPPHRHKKSSLSSPKNELVLRFFCNELDGTIPHRHEDIVVYDDMSFSIGISFVEELQNEHYV